MVTSRKTILAIAGLAACQIMAATPLLAQSPAFAGLSGAWSGSGTIALADGSRERLRCRASYRVSAGDSTLQQSLRCASDSYKFDLSSDVVSEGGRVSGSWSETSRGISGSLQGRASGGRIAVAVDSPAFSANLTLTTTGNRQSVSIVSQGDIRNVSIALVRS
jgi:hypothetical protein